MFISQLTVRNCSCILYSTGGYTIQMKWLLSFFCPTMHCLLWLWPWETVSNDKNRLPFSVLIKLKRVMNVHVSQRTHLDQMHVLGIHRVRLSLLVIRDKPYKKRHMKIQRAPIICSIKQTLSMLASPLSSSSIFPLSHSISTLHWSALWLIVKESFPLIGFQWDEKPIKLYWWPSPSRLSL